MRLRFLCTAVLAACGLFLGAYTTALAQSEENVFLPLITYDYTPGWHWGEAYTVTVSAQTSAAPLAAIDRAGWPHLFWHYRTTDGNIHHLFLREDGWNELLPSQGITGDSSLRNQPLVDQDGRIHLLWFLDPPDSLPYRFQYAAFDGAQWSEPNEVFRIQYSSSKAWMRLDQNNQVRLGMTTGYLNWRALLLMLQGSWLTLADFELPTDASVVWPDTGAGAHLFGDDTTMLKYWRWLNGAADDEQTLGPGRLLTRNVAFDSANNMHMYWKANVNVGGSLANLLHHQCVDQQRMLSAVSYHGSSSSVREAVGANEHGTLFALAWQERTRKRIMMWDGCTPGSTATIPEDAGQTTTLRALAISSNPRKACVFLQQGVTAIYTVRCADLD